MPTITTVQSIAAQSVGSMAFQYTVTSLQGFP